MRTIDISTKFLSEAVWGRVFENATARRVAEGDAFFAAMGKLDALREKAQYKTGSITTSAQWVLYALAYMWAPEAIAEVGTFIGKSAIALAMGADAAGVAAEVHTCDNNNRFDLPSVARSKVIQYQGADSTQMFKELVEDGYSGRIQLLHVDGRLQPDDLPLLQRLLTQDVIVALDDFEGIEKGVANMFNLRAAGALKDHLLVYPPSASLLERHGFHDACTTALLIPLGKVRFTAQ